VATMVATVRRAVPVALEAVRETQATFIPA
jgi:hypothetical protein